PITYRWGTPPNGARLKTIEPSGRNAGAPSAEGGPPGTGEERGSSKSERQTADASGSAASTSGIRWTRAVPVRSDTKTTDRPSADAEGAQSSEGSRVRRVSPFPSSRSA